jgi:hypothetical protein
MPERDSNQDQIHQNNIILEDRNKRHGVSEKTNKTNFKRDLTIIRIKIEDDSKITIIIIIEIDIERHGMIIKDKEVRVRRIVQIVIEVVSQEIDGKYKKQKRKHLKLRK